MNHKHAIDGQDSGPRNLYQAMGLAEKGCNKYKTDDLEEYKVSLRVMNMADLQSQCIACGIRPNSDRRSLIKKLEKEFVASQSSYKGAVQNRKRSAVPQSKGKREKGEDIMKRLNGGV